MSQIPPPPQPPQNVELREDQPLPARAQMSVPMDRIETIRLHTVYDDVTELSKVGAAAIHQLGEAMELLKLVRTDAVFGCRFCDAKGVLRDRSKPHDSDCLYRRIGCLLHSAERPL